MFRDEFVTLGIRLFFRFRFVRREPFVSTYLASRPTSAIIRVSCFAHEPKSISLVFAQCMSMSPLPSHCVSAALCNEYQMDLRFYVNQSKSHFSCYLFIVTFESTSFSLFHFFSANIFFSFAAFSFSRPKCRIFTRVFSKPVIFQLFSGCGCVRRKR